MFYFLLLHLADTVEVNVSRTWQLDRSTWLNAKLITTTTNAEHEWYGFEFLVCQMPYATIATNRKESLFAFWALFQVKVHFNPNHKRSCGDYGDKDNRLSSLAAARNTEWTEQTLISDDIQHKLEFIWHVAILFCNVSISNLNVFFALGKSLSFWQNTHSTLSPTNFDC